MSDDTQRDNQLHIAQQKARAKFTPDLDRVVPQNQDQSGNCAAPGCTNPGGAFTSERDGRMYEFCSEACRAAFESPAG
jgi:hypothetical protein